MSITQAILNRKREATFSGLQRQLGFIGELRVAAVAILCLIGVIFAVAIALLLAFLNDEGVHTSNLVLVEQERALTQKIVSDATSLIASEDLGYQPDLAVNLKDWESKRKLLLLHLKLQEQEQLHVADANYNALQLQAQSLLARSDATHLQTDVQMRFAMFTLQGQADVYFTALERISQQQQDDASNDTLKIYQSVIMTGILLAVVLTLTWTLAFRPAIQRLKSNVLEITEAENAFRQQQREIRLAKNELHEILIEAQRAVNDVQPKVKVMRPDVYAVQNGRNGFYLVHYNEGRGFLCGCPWYKHTGVCLHTRWAHAKHQEIRGLTLLER